MFLLKLNDSNCLSGKPQLEVTSLIPIHSQPQPGWGIWPDVSNDDRVHYMEQLIADHFHFEKHLWHGGDTSEPIFTPEPVSVEEDEPVIVLKPRKKTVIRKKSSTTRNQPKEACKPRKTAKKTTTVRKQRRISSYFHAAASSPTSNEQIFELLKSISDQLSNLQKDRKKDAKSMRILIKLNKSRRCHKFSAFHTLREHSKKVHKVDRGCQTESTPIASPPTVSYMFSVSLLFLAFLTALFKI